LTPSFMPAPGKTADTMTHSERSKTNKSGDGESLPQGESPSGRRVERVIAMMLAKRRLQPRRFEGSPRRKEQSRLVKVRAILWTVGMAYTGILLTGQDLRTLNSLSATEGLLGALAGFLLAIMFTLREKRRRPALIAHSIAQILPNCGIPPENRGSNPKLTH
jgi:hypothetical protein